MEFGLVLVVFLGFVALVTAAQWIVIVKQSQMVVIETLGKYTRVCPAGFNTKIPYIEQVAGTVNMRVQQLDVTIETKTEDNVFVHVVVAVQYFILPERVYEAYYRLDNPEGQINSYVFDVVRARVPKLKLDELFDKKDDIADAVKTELSEDMEQFGYGIVKSLVTDIDPDPKVKAAMNEINAAQRERAAAYERGEADRIMQVKSAQAEAESKALQGKGLADQRKAIIEGLRESVENFQESVKGSTPQDVMNLVLMTQYFDCLKDIGSMSKTSTIFVPHSPSSVSDVYNQLISSMMMGNDPNPMQPDKGSTLNIRQQTPPPQPPQPPVQRPPYQGQ